MYPIHWLQQSPAATVSARQKLDTRPPCDPPAFITPRLIMAAFELYFALEVFSHLFLGYSICFIVDEFANCSNKTFITPNVLRGTSATSGAKQASLSDARKGATPVILAHSSSGPILGGCLLRF